MRYLKKFEKKENKHIMYILTDGKNDGITWDNIYLFCVTSIELEVDGDTTYKISNYYFCDQNGELYNEKSKTVYYKSDLNILYETEDFEDALRHLKMFKNVNKYNI